MQGDGSYCGTWSTVMTGVPFTCSGKDTMVALPGPDDFVVTLEDEGKVAGGNAHLIIKGDENYSAMLGDCHAVVTGGSNTEFTGQSGTGTLGSVTFIGKVLSNGNQNWSGGCPTGGAQSLSGSGPGQEGGKLVFQTFDPWAGVGSRGICRISALDELSSLLAPLFYACTYRIEAVE
jgi:hypothetical protein